MDLYRTILCFFFDYILLNLALTLFTFTKYTITKARVYLHRYFDQLPEEFDEPE